MIVCVCKRVSDRQIHAAVVEEGADSLAALRERLGVGSQCGRCVPTAAETIEQALAGCCAMRQPLAA